VKILAIDTATENCSAALFINGQLSMREALLGRGHAERILPMVEDLLRAADVALRALSAVAFGRGPGAFTGVRLAASVTQGLAFGAGLPVVPISDLRALAQRVLDDEPAADRVLVCNDARMHEVYSGTFERGAAGRAVAVGAECVGKPELVPLPPQWSAPSGAALFAAGTGFAAYPQLRAVAAAVRGIREGLWPRAAEIARLAAPEVEAGRVFTAAEALPVYLRDNVAQVPKGTSKSLI
jgi:tRNA threonylcarbamoyladenosine biosynthesis protein TsaB